MLHVIHRIRQSFEELIKVLFIQENLVLFIGKTILLKALLALSNGKIVVV